MRPKTNNLSGMKVKKIVMEFELDDVFTLVSGLEDIVMILKAKKTLVGTSYLIRLEKNLTRFRDEQFNFVDSLKKAELAAVSEGRE